MIGLNFWRASLAALLAMLALLAAQGCGEHNEPIESIIPGADASK